MMDYKQIMGVLLVAFIGNIYSLQAQTQGVDFSLTEAVQYGVDNNVQLKNATLDIEQSKKSVTELMANGLPQLNASVGYTDYLSLPTSLIPAEFFGGQPGDFMEVSFGTKQNLSASVNASQMIFDGSYLIGLKASRMYVDMTRKQSLQSERDLKLNITKSYYLALISHKAFLITLNNQANMDKMLNETQAMYDNGLIESIEVDRLKLSKSNIDAQLKSLKRQDDFAKLLLKFQMGMDIADSINLTDSLEGLFDPSSDLLNQSFNQTNRLEYTILDMQEQLTEMNVKRFRAMYLPTLSVNAVYQQNAQRDQFDFYKSNLPWFQTALVGVNLNIPIFDSFRKRSTVQKEQINLMKLHNSKAQLSQSLSIEVNQARMDYLNALEQIASQEQNLQLARHILQISTIKYQEGVGSSLEVNNAQNTLLQTQNQYINAIYNLLIAKIELEKALGIN